jgi:hypothetical protein
VAAAGQQTPQNTPGAAAAAACRSRRSSSSRIMLLLGNRVVARRLALVYLLATVASSADQQQQQQPPRSAASSCAQSCLEEGRGCRACVKAMAEQHFVTPRQLPLHYAKAHPSIPDPELAIAHHHFLDRPPHTLASAGGTAQHGSTAGEPHSRTGLSCTATSVYFLPRCLMWSLLLLAQGWPARLTRTALRCVHALASAPSQSACRTPHASFATVPSR